MYKVNIIIYPPQRLLYRGPSGRYTPQQGANTADNHIYFYFCTKYVTYDKCALLSVC